AYNPKPTYLLTAVPFVHEDGFTISMTLVPGFKRCVGYDANPVRSTDASGGMPAIGRVEALTRPPQPAETSRADGNVVQQQSFAARSMTPVPVYETKQFATNAVVWDGQTAILAFGEQARMPAPIILGE